jgi:hypothetical protein
LLEFPFDWNQTPDKLRSQAQALLDRYSSRATQFILDKARKYANANGKKLLVVVNDPYRALGEMTRTGKRFDQEVVDYLEKEDFDYFDMNRFHLEEMQQLKLPYDVYIKQFMVGGFGHYNPRGNHLFAYAIKDKVVNWLDPKPLPYQQSDAQTVNFRGYLKGGPQ